MKNNHPCHPQAIALTTNKQAKSEWIGLPPAFPLPHCAKAQMTCNEGLGRYIKTSLLWMAPGLLTRLTLTRRNKSQKWAASQRKADRTQGRGLSRNWSNFWAPPTFFASWHFVDVSYALLACIVSKLHCIKRQYCLPLQNMILMIERNACRGRGESWKQYRWQAW